MMEQKAPADVPAAGEVITFYSYKGGVGRSMALANVACVLASRKPERGVLMVDWDLEAPGLHRFFAGHVKDTARLTEGPGVIELFEELDAGTSDIASLDELEREDATHELLSRIELKRFIQHTSIPSLDLLKAGRFDDEYGRRVAAFRWDSFHRRTPWLFAMLAEKLVTVFTPNRQSLDGLDALISRATEYRRNSSDLRPLKVYPLPSRIEASLDKLRADWRYGNSEQNIEGYQPLFDGALRKSYGRLPWHPDEYFNQVQIQQVPDYAYGERIAVLDERGHDVFSLTASYERFTQWLVGEMKPQQERRPEVLSESSLVVRMKELSDEVNIEAEAHKRAGARMGRLGSVLRLLILALAVVIMVWSRGWSGGWNGSAALTVTGTTAAIIAVLLSTELLLAPQRRVQSHNVDYFDYVRLATEVQFMVDDAGNGRESEMGLLARFREATEEFARLRSRSTANPFDRDYRRARNKYSPPTSD